MNIAEASLAETEYLLMVSRDLKYLKAENSEILLRELTEIARMLSALRSKVDRDAKPTPD